VREQRNECSLNRVPVVITYCDANLPGFLKHDDDCANTAQGGQENAVGEEPGG
jgi:hypothetical protein